MRNRIRTVAFLVALSGVYQARAQADLRLVVPDTSAFQGEVISARIQISDFRRAGEPVLPDMPGFDVGPLSRAGDSSFMQIINGRRTQSVTRSYRFELTPTRTGTLTIPPISAEVDGRTMRTRPVRIRVRKSDAAQLFSAELSCDRRRLYVGQRAMLKLTIWVKPAVVEGMALNENQMWGQVDSSRLGPFTGRVGVRRVPDNGSEAGVRYGYMTSALVIPKTPGPLTIDNLTVSMSYPIEFRRDIFRSLTVARARRLRVAPTTDVEVLPLPAEGRPANFGGAVGRYTIRARVDATSVRVGDPIHLTIDVSGDGPIETLGPPKLASNVRMSDDFRLSNEALAGEIVGGAKRFTQLIRAKRADVREIPPIEYPYFDPDSGEYAVARSRSIPIDVAAVESLQASDLTEIATPDASAGRPLETLNGLHGNETSESLLLANHRPILAWHVAAVTFGPAALFVLVWAPWSYRRNRLGDVAGRRRQAALASARRRIERARTLAPAECAREIRASMSGYLADRLNQPVGRFDGAASTDFLKEHNVDPALIETWRAVIDQCEQASFGGNINGNAAALAHRARECLKQVERKRI